MKKFTAFFMAIAILLSLAGSLPAAAATDSSPLCSGYYGVNRTDCVIGQIAPGTEESVDWTLHIKSLHATCIS